MSTIDRLKKTLNNETGAVISSPVNRRYFTGFPSSNGFLLVTSSSIVFLTDSRYLEAAKKSITVCPVGELIDAKRQIPEFFNEHKLNRILFESDRLYISDFERMKAFFDIKEPISDGSLDKAINEMRAIKNSFELECIKKAQKIAENAFSYILDFIKHGVTEKQTALELDFFMLKNGAEALSFDTIVVSGKNSALPHGVPSDKKVSKGDFITMDFGAVYNGYHSDMTRTVILGEPSKEQIKVYETVLKAQNEALGVLKHGISGVDADKAARDIIESAGFGKYFGHGTGHSVGLEIHENPSLSPRSEYTLFTGNVVTVEPGIYLPRKFGVRIEDMAVITKDGYENLTNSTKELICL